MIKRSSGILVHITSLPSRFGIGDLGPAAYRFADFLAATRQSFWQVLPLNPTEREHGNSPYTSMSTFGLNPLLICLERLVDEGYLAPADLEPVPSFPEDRFDYAAVIEYKVQRLRHAYEKNRDTRAREADFEEFCEANRNWLDDFALFNAVREQQQGNPWNEWPKALADREGDALAAAA
jgi:4-alpha-glucanotransferase